MTENIADGNKIKLLIKNEPTGLSENYFNYFATSIRDTRDTSSRIQIAISGEILVIFLKYFVFLVVLTKMATD